jgi:hypothetical protein
MIIFEVGRKQQQAIARAIASPYTISYYKQTTDWEDGSETLFFVSWQKVADRCTRCQLYRSPSLYQELTVCASV